MAKGDYYYLNRRQHQTGVTLTKGTSMKFIYKIFICTFLFTFILGPHLTVEASSTLENEAMEKIKANLKDSDSAKFQNVKTITNSKAEESVCGEVNARNAFGGYTGFTPFAYTNKNIYLVSDDDSNSIHYYQISGCAGPQAELSVRLENEAAFNCNVIWNLMANVIVNKENKETALQASIEAVKARAIENGGSVSADQEKAIYAQFSQSLDQTLANKKQVKAIEKDPKYQGASFIDSCKLTTASMLKTQAGIKQF